MMGFESFEHPDNKDQLEIPNEVLYQKCFEFVDPLKSMTFESDTQI